MPRLNWSNDIHPSVTVGPFKLEVFWGSAKGRNGWHGRLCERPVAKGVLFDAPGAAKDAVEAALLDACAEAVRQLKGEATP